MHLACAGRTDAGVHALGQCIHLDLPAALPDPARVQRRVNGLLPPSVRLRDLRPAEAGFDARFSALWRRYRYLVTDDEAPDPLQRRTVLAVRGPLDAAAMQVGAGLLHGEHDFGSFCRPRPGATTRREVLECSWTRTDDGLLVLQVQADAFCHSMVRSIVGASLEVGRGRRAPQWMAGLLSEPSRQQAAPVAPPHGLVLMEVGYPPVEQYATRARAARRRRGEPDRNDAENAG